MNKKILAFLGIILSLSISSTSIASAASTFYMPPSNTAAGDYVVISNESTDVYELDEKVNNISYPTLLQSQKDNKAYQNNDKFKVDVNKTKVPKEILEKGPNKPNYNVEIKQSRVNDSKIFNVQDNTTNGFYTVTAKLLYLGSNCEIWVADSKITSSMAENMGREFDTKIYPSVTSNFATPTDIDGNGRINILCYDIKDGFSGNGGYIAGYFYGIDLFSDSVAQANGLRSNEGEMLYIDTYPSMYYGNSTVDPSAAYGTMAHEMQHLVNFSKNFISESSHTQMPTWIDEGLAEASDQLYANKPLVNRIDFYNSSYDITSGHSLIDWNNYNALPNYSLSYLFFQYLRIQCGVGNSIYKEIINSTSNDEKAIEEVIKKYIDPNLTLGEFITRFRMALVRLDPSGQYGFKNEAGFNLLQKKIYSGDLSSINLSPGGAIVVKGGTNNATNIPTTKGKNIKYLGTLDIYKSQDVNKDGKIDALDLSTLANNYNKFTTTSDWYKDPNRDGIYDIYDLIKISRLLK